MDPQRSISFAAPTIQMSDFPSSLKRRSYFRFSFQVTGKIRSRLICFGRKAAPMLAISHPRAFFAEMEQGINRGITGN